MISQPARKKTNGVPQVGRFSRDRIRAIREQHGLSQAAFGALLAKSVGVGYTRAMVSAVERGTARPSLRYLEAVARAFKLDMKYFWELIDG